MTLEGVRCGFHGVFPTYFLIVIMWLAMQGKGYGVEGENNTTSTSVIQQPMELATTPSKAPAYNDTLGMKLYFIAVSVTF